MRTLLLILVFACLCISACQKASYEDLSKSSNNSFPASLSKLASANVSSLSSSQACRLPLQQDVKPDSILVPTRLGASLTGNPYAVANMQQASLNLYGTDQGIVANRKYIRYRPTSLNQMEILAESDLDLFDYPLDQEVEEEGDYYPQPGLGENDLPWLYTVVDVSYQPITGIPYEELARVYIPDSDVYLEDEAFRLTGNVISPDDCSGTTPAGSLNGDVSSALVDFQCAPGYYWDADQHRCIPDHPITPPPPPPTSQPAGMIRVWDNSVGERGVRRTRVVLRRFLKIDRVYTDDNGNFISSKRFRNKVNVIVKFKSTQLTTRGLRGVRFWQMLFPIKQAIGKYSGNLNNFPPYLFTSDRLGGDARNRNWWAALLMNAYLEYNEHAAALGVSAAPNNLRILLTNWHDAAGGGSTPMNYLRTNEDLPSQAYLQQFVVSPLTAWGAQAYNSFYNGNAALRGMDMTLGYNTVAQWNSDKVKQLMFHELSHASHYSRVGQSWWNSFVYSEAYAIFANGINSPNSPYGTGNDGLISDYISLAESWAEHLGRTIADRVYGLNSTAFWGQQSMWYSNNQFIAGSSHVNYLENFDPNNINDPFRWIPDGIYYDLVDARNEGAPVIDNVSGYTNQQLFNAMGSDVRSLPAYRERLLSQNNNNLAVQVNELFNSYHH